MKCIKKNLEPPELIDYKKTPGVCFEHMTGDIKQALKISLIKEQGYLCCYCGKRIKETDKLKIEHILPQSKFSCASLQYCNMMLSCDGGQEEREHGNEEYSEHCDSKKKDTILPFSPTLGICEDFFVYCDDGSIDALPGKNDGVKEVIRILGLDNPVLKHKRKAAIDAYKEIDSSLDEWKKVIARLNKKNSKGKYLEFCHAVKNYIEYFKLQEN